MHSGRAPPEEESSRADGMGDCCGCSSCAGGRAREGAPDEVAGGGAEAPVARANICSPRRRWNWERFTAPSPVGGKG